MDTENPATIVIRIIASIGLIGALLAAGRSIYRGLPNDEAEAIAGDTSTRAETELLIVLRYAPENRASRLDVPVELYPVDIMAAQREFLADPHPGKRFDEFLAQRRNGRSPVRVRLDPNGRAIVRLSSGDWWVRASVSLADNVWAEWRLPISIGGRRQTVELTSENAYERTKRF